MSSVSFMATSFDSYSSALATAVSSLDTQTLLQVTPTVSTNASNIVQHSFPKGLQVQALLWISQPTSHTPKKKQARHSKSGKKQPQILAVATLQSEIHLFSPSQGAVIATLSGAHDQPITALAEGLSSRLWSCDSSGTLAEWDLNTNSLIRTIKSPVSPVSSISTLTGSKVLIGTNAVNLVDVADPKETLESISCFINPITQLFSYSDDDLVMAASRGERNISIVSLKLGQTVGILVARGEIRKIVSRPDFSTTALVTEEGDVEIFTNVVKGIKKQGSNVAECVIRIKRPGPNGERVSVQDLCFPEDDEDKITIVWAEFGGVPVIETVSWKGKKGVVEIEREVKKVGQNQPDNFDKAANSRFRETQAIVKGGNDFTKLDDDSDDDEGGSTLADRLDALEVDSEKKDSVESRTTLGKSAQKLKTPVSFAVVITQALKTNDSALLETCFSNRTEDFIEESIKRIDTATGVLLLEQIAERIARNPGRAPQLAVWIKWTLIVHGGYLSRLPNLQKTLGTLHATLANKISMLPRLLTLHGRVEMLKAQIKLRRELNQNSVPEEEEEVESEVEYVEDAELIVDGEADDYDEDDEEEQDEVVASGFIELEASESEPEDSEDEVEDVVDEDAMEGIQFEDEEELEIAQPEKSTANKKKSKKGKKFHK